MYLVKLKYESSSSELDSSDSDEPVMTKKTNDLDSESDSEPEVKPEGSKRGRKPLGGEFTSQEVNRWKLEGVKQLSKIEKRIDKYEAETVKFTNEIIRLQKELDRRKRFFGVDQEELNESIEKIKLDFKRFI